MVNKLIKKLGNLSYQRLKATRRQRRKANSLLPLSLSTLSHTGLKADREVGHGKGMIYLRQVAPPGVSVVPGDTLFSVYFSLSPSVTAHVQTLYTCRRGKGGDEDATKCTT